jgi:hypothetical protein
MACDNFTFESVKDQFGLNLSIAPFCQNLPMAAPSATFASIFAEWFPLAQQARSEKAKSELLVSRLLTPYVVEAPVIILVKAKKGDLDAGLFQPVTQGLKLSNQSSCQTFSGSPLTSTKAKNR